MDYKEELPYAYWLHNIKGVGNKGIEKLLRKEKMPSRIFELTKEQMHQIYFEEEKVFTERAIEYIVNSKQGWNIKKEFEKLRTSGIAFYPKFHPSYPKALKEIPDAPWGLYVMGRLPEEKKMTVAVVGARECSAYGAYVAKQLGAALSENGIQVVSGMAKGIDSLAQWAAMEEGRAYGVLGSGVDVCYPYSNKKVYEKLIETGGIISEYSPGTEAKACNFPARNRIISGLSQVVVVIEAKEKSGTLITVDMALEQGRDVYVVPGRITDSLSTGCNRLIRQGAAVLASVEEFIKEIREIYVNYDFCDSRKDTTGEKKEECFKKWENIILENIDYYPKTLQKIYDDIGRSLQYNKIPEMQDIMKMLINLEKIGKISIEAGCYYVKS